MNKRTTAGSSNVIEHPVGAQAASGPPMTAAEVIASVSEPFVRPKVESVEDALRLQTDAALMRARAPELEQGDDAALAMLERAEAGDMDAAALAYLDPLQRVGRLPAPGNGGEMMLQTQDERCDYPRLIDTLAKSPDMLNVEASRQRLELASKAGALTLGVDIAETIKARNSMERMLAQQLGALHGLAMRFAGAAGDLLRHHKTWGQQTQSIEAARNAAAAAKLMTAFQTGYIALDRVRRGGRQTVKVVYQQVAVGKGGKAIVAGSIKSRGPRKKLGRGRTGGRRRNAV